MNNDNINKYEKIITINDESKETIIHCVIKLISFMYESSSNIKYFRLRLKESENSPFSKDLLLEWACQKQTENQNPVEDKFKGMKECYDRILLDVPDFKHGRHVGGL